MQIGAFLIFIFLYINYEAEGFEFDFVGKNSNNFADGTDYVRSIGSRRDLSMSAGSPLERPSVPRRLIQPPPLKRSVDSINSVDEDRLLNLYRWLAYSAPVPDY